MNTHGWSLCWWVVLIVCSSASFGWRSSSMQSLDQNKWQNQCQPRGSTRHFLSFVPSLITSLRNVQTHREGLTWIRQTDGKWEIQMRHDEQQFGQTERLFGVSLLALGQHLAPLPHHVLLLICHSARGSPAQIPRGHACVYTRNNLC